MFSPRFGAIVITVAVSTGCGDGGGGTARTPAEAVTLAMTGSSGVKVTRNIRFDYGEQAAKEDGSFSFAGEYEESRTTGVVGATGADLTTTFHYIGIPDELKGIIPADLDHMTTRTITIPGSGTYLNRVDRRDVPEGKSWLYGRDATCEQLLDLKGPATIHDLLSPEMLGKLTAAPPSPGETVDGAATLVYEGSAPQSEFGVEVQNDDPVLRAQFREQFGSARISWRLWVGPDLLPRRAHVTFTQDGEPTAGRAEIDLTAWGTEVTVEPPPSDQVHETTSCQDPEP
ncbi:hypothetical protein FDA94_30760 [Herbidospora galbida]|uniref:LppX_LprAFG lipoprotein n=1 Tax=Herbidospora galbida TaxID=2575442 RepID=A0A4U3M5E5_9ACTN|nr:hypothetical protein [Herbidospora galbida]TKK84098.1 hypothetical protein FDA94_30760 [Herbidospora galbida]